jgi:hypothetical protein
MRIQARYYVTALALFGLALPVWAHTDTAHLSVTDPTMIGGTQLKAGDYRLEIKDNQTQMTVVDTTTGKTVAEVPCHWIQLPNKPDATDVVMRQNQVTEVDFGGKTQAVQVVNR